MKKQGTKQKKLLQIILISLIVVMMVLQVFMVM